MSEQHHEGNDGQDDERSRERPDERHPRIWIGSLADYNNGILHGEWVDAAVEDEVLVGRARDIVARSETPDAEEWAIFDHEDFGPFKPGQYETLDLIARVARGIAEHGDAFGAWAEMHDADPVAMDQFEVCYFGEYDEPADWAREVTEDLDIEAKLREHFGDLQSRYFRFDADGYARDAWINGEIYIAHKDGGGCWIFSTC
ncbi:MAG: antirestriction protein ArdA [Dermatophilaceae bacterium]